MGEEKVWGKVWEGDSDELGDFYLERTKRSNEWLEIKKKIINNFGTFKDIKVIDIGSGRGTYSLLFAMEGSKVALLDYSKEAIKRIKRFFKKYNQKAEFTLGDALNINKSMLNKFDVVMSYGVAEYFDGGDRAKFFKTNFNLIKGKGIVIIGVPNKVNPFYRLWKFLSETFGRWKFGKEYFISKSEFREIGKEFNAKSEFIGSYLFDTHFNFKKRLMRFLGRKEYDLRNIGKQFRTPLDKYLSKTIVAIYIKNNLSPEECITNETRPRQRSTKN